MGDRRPRQPKFTLHQWSGDNIRFGWLSPLSRCFSHRFEIGNNIYSLDLSRICEIDSGIYTHTYIYIMNRILTVAASVSLNIHAQYSGSYTLLMVIYIDKCHDCHKLNGNFFTFHHASHFRLFFNLFVFFHTLLLLCCHVNINFS